MTISELKNRLTVGTKLTVSRGDMVTDYVVAKNHSTAIFARTESMGGLARIEWPKKGELMETDDGFILSYKNGIVLNCVFKGA